MSSYLLNKDTSKGSIDYMEYDLDGYVFKPRNKINQSYIKVTQVKIYQRDMIDSLLTQKFERKFDRLAQIILNFLYQDDEEAEEGDFMILLDEVARLKAMVEIKYRKFLGIEKYKLYLDQLYFLDTQIRQKLAVISFKNNLDEEYENSHGRSR